MDLKVFATMFAAIFVAELGDKSQLATVLFAADKDVNKGLVFIAVSSALVLATAIGVLAGGLLSAYVGERVLQYVAGAGFMLIGAYTLYSA